MALKKSSKLQSQIAIPGFFTCEQAATELEMNPDTVRRYVHRGVIQSAGLLGDQYLISQQQLDDFRKSRRGRGNPSFTKHRE